MACRARGIVRGVEVETLTAWFLAAALAWNLNRGLCNVGMVGTCMHAHRKSSVSSLLAYPSNAHLPVLTCCSSVIPQECAFPALAAQMAGGSSVRAPPLRLQVSAACLPTAHTQSSDHYRNGPAPSFDETNFQIDPALLPGTPSLAPYSCRSSMRRDGARLLRFRPSVPRRMQRGVLRSCPWWHWTPAAS